MKKTLVSALTTALVVGAASTTFAAANPFEDVPADHWAYDAVAQLAADGIVEGYGDGTYRGDQAITRYEMAQMVARAMAKNPSGADKALIDKLAAEFADELNSLGVRVAALEKKVDNVKWTGALRYRYINRHETDNPRETKQYITLRLEPEMQINNHWTAHARIDYDHDNSDNMNTGSNLNNDTVIERAWVQGDYDNFQILLGRLPYCTIVDNGMIFDDNVNGGQITFGKNIMATLTVGRSDSMVPEDEDVLPQRWETTSSYQGIEIYNDRDAKFTWGVGYHHVQNKAFFSNKLGGDKNAANIWEVGLGAKLGEDFALNGAYAWNTATGDKSVKWAASVQLDYKGAEPEEKGSFGAFLAYRRLGAAAVSASPTYDAFEANTKGWEVGVDYVFFKNVMGTVKYGDGKKLVGDGHIKTLFTELNFFF